MAIGRPGEYWRLGIGECRIRIAERKPLAASQRDARKFETGEGIMEIKTQLSFLPLLTMALLLASGVGCEVPEIDDATPTANQPAPTAEKPQAKETPAAPPADPREFTANDPKKGKKSRGVGGYAGAVFGARFWAEHQMIINNINHALQLYNATHGNYPKTHDEFMEEIIKFNQIKLPELDEGIEYIYDPEDHTLKTQPMAETE